MAFAHDGPARIELNAQQTSSGAELEIRGVNIAPEQPITLSLIGAGGEYALGTAVGDAHGDFVIGVRVPAEAPAGAYTVRAFGANRVMVGAPLALLGMAIEEEGGQREQEEPLLAPMPSPLPATAVPRPAAAVAPASAPAPAAPPRPFPVWLFVALAAVMLAVGVLLAFRRRAAGEVSR